MSAKAPTPFRNLDPKALGLETKNKQVEEK
jgi:hypothetical protein